MRLVLPVSSVLVLAWLIAARVSGPTDAFDQEQPLTMSYTTDMLVHGRWVLPYARGLEPATKPPLYNWIAAPVVGLTGFSSDLGHKLPSLVALVLCWAAIVVVGRFIDREHGGVLGWLAGLAFCSNYALFKLGYLARPDMLLTLWLVLGWAAATARCTEAGQRHGRLLAVAFWSCVTLAAMTKGPAALTLPAYALIAPRVLTGSWRAGGFGWSWGPLLASGVFALWVWAAYRLAPSHVVEHLWWQEVYGRITGLGPAAPEGGISEMLRRLAHMPFYYVVRFAPWSVLAVLAMVHLWRRRPGVRWMTGATLFIGVTVGLYTLITNKRADYLAAAYGPSSLLAAWWLLRVCPRPSVRPLAEHRPWLAPAAAALVMVVLTLHNQRQWLSPTPTFGADIGRFITEVETAVEAEPGPLIFWNEGDTHLQAHLGCSGDAGMWPLEALLSRGEPFWLIAGQRPDGEVSYEQVVRQLARPGSPLVTERCRSVTLPRRMGWPGLVALYRVRPAQVPPELSAKR